MYTSVSYTTSADAMPHWGRAPGSLSICATIGLYTWSTGSPVVGDTRSISSAPAAGQSISAASSIISILFISFHLL